MQFQNVKYDQQFIYQGQIYTKRLRPTTYTKQGLQPTHNAEGKETCYFQPETEVLTLFEMWNKYYNTSESDGL